MYSFGGKESPFLLKGNRKMAKRDKVKVSNHLEGWGRINIKWKSLFIN